MNKKSRILLCIPPCYDTEVPPLGTPALKGWLDSNGTYAKQVDLNMYFYNYIKENKIERILHPEYLNKKINGKVYYYKILEYVDNYRRSILQRYNFEKYFGASFAFAEKLLSSKQLFRYIKDFDENIFAKFFLDFIFGVIEKEQPILIGFSVTAPSQVIASFTFGYLIKQYFPNVKIVLGGQWVTLFRGALMKKNDFNCFYDFIIYSEGETPLLKLIECIENNGKLTDVPNLIYFESKKFQISHKFSEENLNSLPPPDFGGLSIIDYGISKEMEKPALTFETSRGCYWNKCIYCVDLPFSKPRYREKSPELVIRDIEWLKNKFGVYRIIISNATTSPNQIRKISQLVLKKRIDIKWWMMARFDPGFTYETLKLIKEAGCERINFGFETINERLLGFIKKGIKPEIIKRVIDDARRLKLEICFQAMIGLPTETKMEALENILFLGRHKGAYGRESVFNIYYLTPGNYIFNHPLESGIKFKKDPKMPFRFFYLFKHIKGEVDLKVATRLIEFKYIIEKDKIKRTKNKDKVDF